MLGNSQLGSATTILSNPIWVIQTSQAVRTLEHSNFENGRTDASGKNPGLIETIQSILAKDGMQ